MNRKKAIIESQYEPAIDSLWIHGKDLKAFINGKWEILGSNLSSEEIEGLKTKVDSLDNRSSQMEESIKNISVTGGASTATAVTFDNTASGMTNESL